LIELSRVAARQSARQLNDLESASDRDDVI